MNTEMTNSFNETHIKGQTYKDILSKRDVWKELERTYNGSLKASTTVSGDVAALTLEIQYKNHNLIFKETDTMPLKVEVYFNLKKKYEFNIYLKDWTDKISSFFGTKFIKIGNIEFDTKYGIQSKESELVIQLLNDNLISEKILRNDLYSLILKYDQKTKTHTLLTVKDRNTKEIKAMTELVDLEFHIVDSFIKQGLIS
jgi:hypothetical protein